MARLSPASTGVVALVFSSILWGTTGTAASFLPDNVSPIAIGASTMACGGILLFIVSARQSLRVVASSGSRRWVLIGAAGVVVYPLAFYASMDLAGVAIGNVVSLGSGPVFAALFEWLWERRPLSRRWVVATAVALTGITLLTLGGHGAVPASSESGAGATASGNLGLGVALGLLAGLSYALFTYASTRAIGAGHPGRAVTGAVFGLGAAVLLPVLIVTGGALVQSASTVSIAAYLALGPMFLAYVLFGFGLTHLRSSVVTTITLLEPVVATILAIVVVGERLELLGWVGLVLILVGVTVLVTARHTAKEPRSF